MSSKPPLIYIGGAAAAVLVVALLAWNMIGSDEPQAADAPTVSASPSAAVSEPSPTTTTAAPVAPKSAEAKPVGRERPLTSPAPLAGGATASVTAIEKVRSEARVPGEVSAPALRFTIKATAGDDRLDLRPVVVNAYYGSDRTPAVAVGAPGAKPFTGRVAPGKSATGVYVFNVPTSERDVVRLEFTWSPDEKPVILTGNVS